MLDEAVREFRRVLELRSSDTVSRFYVGLVLARQRKWEDALAAFSEAGTQPGAKLAVFHNMAYCLEQLNRYEEARLALEESVKRGRRHRRARADVARRRESVGGQPAGRRSGAGRGATVFGNRPPTPAWFHYAGLAAALLGDGKRAAAILTEGAVAYPHSGEPAEQSRRRARARW
jgi:tetratricopeptide (TPR) repeat protein